MNTTTYSNETYVKQTIDALIKAQKNPIEKAILAKENLKYKNSDKIQWLIFNIPAMTTCPGACNGCKNSCYARKAEKRFPKTVLVSRYKNFFLTLKDSFVESMVKRLKKYITNKKSKAYKVLKNNGIVVMRIHEAGDFYNFEYLKKWLDIARQVPEIQFVCYTKSFDFFENLSLADIPENFRSGLNFSVWEDMPTEQKKKAYKLAKKFNCRVYTALWETTEKALNHGCTESLENTNRRYAKCNCVDCGKCGICWKSRLNETIVAIH